MTVEAPAIYTRVVSKVNTDVPGPALEIQGVPASIDWQPVADFLTSIGIDITRVPAFDGGVVIGWESIRCTLYAENADGSRFVDLATGKVAMHSVHIPIVRPKPADDD